MSVEEFQSLIQQVTSAIKGKPVASDLAAALNDQFPPDGEVFQNIRAACDAGIKEGWLCAQEHGGIKFGRVIKDVDGFSVDVVLMKDIVGPHHRHPKGEIDMIMPTQGDAKFDGTPEGWMVYGPDTAHKPTVTGGEAVVLYLLPGGEIEFTKG
jgi:hypothetical protein